MASWRFHPGTCNLPAIGYFSMIGANRQPSSHVWEIRSWNRHSVAPSASQLGAMHASQASDDLAAQPML